MGCDIHAYAERYNGKYWEYAGVEPFQYRNYGLFGFLADVRNYSHVTPLDKPRGLPSELSLDTKWGADKWEGDGHSYSWFSLSELLTHDYDKVFWDRRITRGNDGAALAKEGEGENVTLRKFLGEDYFRSLQIMLAAGDGDANKVRVIFWFDN